MSNELIRNYFHIHPHFRIEWINDSSCNIVFGSGQEAQEAVLPLIKGEGMKDEADSTFPSTQSGTSCPSTRWRASGAGSTAAWPPTRTRRSTPATAAPASTTTGSSTSRSSAPTSRSRPTTKSPRPIRRRTSTGKATTTERQDRSSGRPRRRRKAIAHREWMTPRTLRQSNDHESSIEVVSYSIINRQLAFQPCKKVALVTARVSDRCKYDGQ